jgi:hypothetical protein
MRIGITGHRHLADPSAWGRVEAELSALFGEHARPGDEALSSLAAGADQVFARVALSRGLRLHAVIPCAGYEATFAPGDEAEGYSALLAASAQVTALDYPAPSDEAYAAAGRWLVDHGDSLFAVWDGRPARGHGGTGEIVDYARARGVRLAIVPTAPR